MAPGVRSVPRRNAAAVPSVPSSSSAPRTPMGSSPAPTSTVAAACLGALEAGAAQWAALRMGSWELTWWTSRWTVPHPQRKRRRKRKMRRTRTRMVPGPSAAAPSRRAWCRPADRSSPPTGRTLKFYWCSPRRGVQAGLGVQREE
uniref:Protein inhibitor of activated STAT 4 n=1 Tax=Pipistrellus kuhlii TaxID=59472 RepID=A0A7J7TAD8_PIPKU|nr:protein inhibitor of activated STAT 4 [Pipistrellus kuhlii]